MAIPRSQWKTTLLALLLVMMVLSLSVVGTERVVAQETTEEPAVEMPPVESTDDPVVPPTTIPTEQPEEVSPTEAIEEVSPVEITEEVFPTEASTDEGAAEVPPGDATEVPPENLSDADLFYEDFEDGDLSDWTLTPGWILTLENENAILMAATPGEVAVINTLAWEHVLLSAQFGLQPGNTAAVAVRSGLEKYTITLNANGEVTLYRGGLLLMQGPLAVIDPAAPMLPLVWHELTAMFSGGTILVAVDGIIQLTYEDPYPLPAGLTAFSTGEGNTGVVMLDNVTLQKLEAPVPAPTAEPIIDVPTAEPTQPPTDVPTAEPTEPPAELITPDAVPVEPETTVETTPDEWVEPETTAETTPEVEPIEEITPEVTPEAEAAEPGVMPETTPEAVLEPEVTPEAAPEVTPEATPDVAPEATPETTPEAAPVRVEFTLDDNVRSKFGKVLTDLLEAYLAEDDAAIEELHGKNNLHRDDTGRYRVFIWIANTADAADVLSLIEMTGGMVVYSDSSLIDAYMPLPGLAPLAALDWVMSIALPIPAASTGFSAAPDAAPLAAGTGTVTPHSYDLIGVNDWHLAGYQGQGVNIAVIDVGFALAGNTADRACVPNPTAVWNDPLAGYAANSKGTSTHGLEVIEVICDLAPQSRVYQYRIGAISEIGAAIDAAVAGGYGSGLFPAANVIVIAVKTDPIDPAANLTAAYNANVVVISSAGNDNPDNNLATFKNSTTTNTTVYVTAESRDKIQITITDDDGDAVVDALGTTLRLINGDLVDSMPAAASQLYDLVDYGLNCVGGCQFVLTIEGTDQEIYTVEVIDEFAPTDPLYASVIPDSSAVSVDGLSQLTTIAEHPNVIAVAAACSWSGGRYALLDDSSRGMVGQPNTSAIKPDIAAPSVVNTSISNDGTYVARCDVDYGFGGTSAAAAHVGGMAALLMSNPNMQGIYNASSGRPTAVKRYLMTRAIDVSQDGFDNGYGAGVVQLGSPYFNLQNQRFMNRNASGTPDYPIPPNAYYVSTAYLPTSEPTGSSSAPFTSAAYALQVASRQAVIDAEQKTVVLMPGEYVSAFPIPSNVRIVAFDLVDSAVLPASHIWVNDSYGPGGILVDNATNSALIGFRIKGSTPLYAWGASEAMTLPFVSPLFVNDSSDIEILDNTFSDFDFTIQVEDSQGIIFRDNVFERFEARVADVTAVFNIRNSGGTTPIRLEQNIFRNNSIPPSVTANLQKSIVRIESSAAEIFSSRFTNNSAYGLVTITQPTPRDVKIFSSWFDNNILAGSLVQLDSAAGFWFVNNTVTNHTLGHGNWGNIVTVGTTVGFSNSTNLDLHNNLFYHNSVVGLVNSYNKAFNLCYSSDGISDGAQNNWFIDAMHGGACNTAINTPANGNLFGTQNADYSVADATSRTVFEQTFFFMEGDPQNPYRLRSQVDPSEPINPGVDTGDECLVVPGILDWADPPDGCKPGVDAWDARGDDRYQGTLDIGAYESYQPGPIELVGVPPFTIEGTEDDLSIQYDLSEFVNEGFEPYLFIIEDYPTIYDTNPNNACGGLPLALDPLTYIVTYCPPENYHTEGVTDDLIAGFTFTAKEALRTTTVSAEVVFDITPTDDGAPTDKSANVYRIVTDLARAINYPLRPNVRIVPGGNPNLVFSHADAVDYVYSFDNWANITQLDADGVAATIINVDELNAALTTAETTGVLSIPVSAYTGVTGTVSFTYDYTDPTGGGTASAGTILITVYEAIAEVGKHDNTSLSIIYDANSNWVPMYDARAYNNTVHRSTTPGDKFDIYFTGDSFVLYWLAYRYWNGTRWVVSGNYGIEYDPDDTGPMVPRAIHPSDLECTYDMGVNHTNPYPGSYPGSIPTAFTSHGTLYSTTGAIVSFGCRGLETLAPGMLHKVTVTNVSGDIRLDAVEIRDGGLKPGYYADTDLEFEYGYQGDWVYARNSSAYDTTFHHTYDTNAELTFVVDGDAVDTLAIYGPRLTSGGQFDVYVNGVYRRTVSQYHSVTLWKQSAVITGIGNGPQTIRIVNTSPVGKRILISGIELFGPTEVLSAGTMVSTLAGHPAFTPVGRWASLLRAAAVNGTVSNAQDLTSSLVFNINGAGITLYNLVRQVGGRYEVCFDGRSDCQVINTAGGVNSRWGHAFTVYVPTAANIVPRSGRHTVEIRSLDTKTVLVEAIEVLGAPTALGPGMYKGNDPAVNYRGTWNPLIHASALDGALYWTNVAGSALEFVVNGDLVDGLAIYRRTAASFGVYTVTVNGLRPTAVSNTSSTTLWKQPAIITGIGGGTQIVRIQSMSGARVEVDAIQLFGLKDADAISAGEVVTDLQAEPRINQIGTWNHINNVNAVGGVFAQGPNTTSVAMFKIDGAGIAVTHTMYSTFGTFEVCFDGNTNCQRYNTAHGGTARWGYVTPVYIPTNPGTLPASGIHTVTIRNVSGAQVRIEAIEVLDTQDILDVGHYDITDTELNFRSTWRPLVVGTNGTLRHTVDYNTNPQASIEFRVDGSATDAITVYYSKTPTGAPFQVCDVTTVTSCSDPVPTYAATTQRGVSYTFTKTNIGIGAGPRIIRIAYGAAIATRRTLQIEAIGIVGPQPVIPAGTVIPNLKLEIDQRLRFTGTWSHVTNTSAVASSLSTTVTQAATLDFTINGAGIVLTRRIYSTFDDIEVCFGGTINCYVITGNKGTAQFGVASTVYIPTPGTPGVYTVRIRKNTDDGRRIQLEALEVIGAQPALGPGLYQDNHPALNYFHDAPDWWQYTSAASTGGSFTRTTSSVSVMEFKVDGNVVDHMIVYYRRLLASSSFLVSIDGVPVTANVNSNASSTLPKQSAVFFDLGAGTHTVRIENPNTTVIDFEAIELIAATPEIGVGYIADPSSHADIRFIGSWVHAANAGAAGGTFSKAVNTSSMMIFEINGAGVAITHRMYSTYGTFEVCFDGDLTNCTQINTGHGAAKWGYVTPVYAPTPEGTPPTVGSHTVMIRNISAKTVIIEAFEVLGDQPVLSPDHYDITDTGLNFRGAWRPLQGGNGGTFRRATSNQPTNTIEFLVDAETVAPDITVYYSKLPTGAWIEVCDITDLPTTYCATPLNTYAATTVRNQFAIFKGTDIGIPTGTGVPRVIRIGYADEGTRQILDIEAINVAGDQTNLPVGTVINSLNTSPDVNFIGPWVHNNAAAAKGGTYSLVGANGSEMRFEIDGAGVAITHSMYLYHGTFEVCFDNNVNCQSVNTAHGSLKWGFVTPFYTTVATASGMPEEGPHTVILRKVGGGQIRIESIEVLGVPDVLTTGHYDVTHTELVLAGAWRPLQVGLGGTLLRTASTAPGTIYFKVNVGDNVPNIGVYYSRRPSGAWMRACDVTGGGEVCTPLNTAPSINTAASITTRSLYAEFAGADLDWAGGEGERIVRISMGTGTYLEIEAIRIFSEIEPIGPGYYENNSPLFDSAYTGFPSTNTTASYRSANNFALTTTGGSMTFDIGGARGPVTGFTVFTTRTASGGDVTICYDPWNGTSNDGTGNEVCATQTTYNATTQYIYGFSSYGLPYEYDSGGGVMENQTYTVTITGTNGKRLEIDAIAVLGRPTNALTVPGGTSWQFYNDNDPNISYSPGSQWLLRTTSTAMGGTRIDTNRYGAVAQARIEGNAFTLYYTASTTNSLNVRICVVSGPSDNTTLSCTMISQRGSLRYKVPVTLYGLDPNSEHDIIIENQHHGGWVRLEGIEVHR